MKNGHSKIWGIESEKRKEEKDMYEYNGLKVSCDWLSFTCNVNTKLVYEFILGFGFTPDAFKKMERGAQGYKGMLRHRSCEITVLYDGAENMGCHMDVKGSAVSYFVDVFRETLRCQTPFSEDAYEYEDFDDVNNLLPVLFRKILGNGWFTRLDIAIDDFGCNYFSCEKVHKILKSCNYVSKFGKWEVDIVHNKKDAAIKGYTVYCGSRKNSDIFLRVYDKQLEQKSKFKEDTDLPLWVRWEFELKNERADNFAEYIINKLDFGRAVMAVLNNYLRFIVPDNPNRSRCSSLPKWQRFVGDVGRLRLTSPKKKKSVERSHDWISRQCLPTIAGLTLAYGGDLTFLTKDLTVHFDRLSASDKEMYEAYFRQSHEREEM